MKTSTTQPPAPQNSKLETRNSKLQPPPSHITTVLTSRNGIEYKRTVPLRQRFYIHLRPGADPAPIEATFPDQPRPTHIENRDIYTLGQHRTVRIYELDHTNINHPTKYTAYQHLARLLDQLNNRPDIIYADNIELRQGHELGTATHHTPGSGAPRRTP